MRSISRVETKSGCAAATGARVCAVAGAAVKEGRRSASVSIGTRSFIRITSTGAVSEQSLKTGRRGRSIVRRARQSERPGEAASAGKCEAGPRTKTSARPRGVCAATDVARRAFEGGAWPLHSVVNSKVVEVTSPLELTMVRITVRPRRLSVPPCETKFNWATFSKIVLAVDVADLGAVERLVGVVERAAGGSALEVKVGCGCWR